MGYDLPITEKRWMFRQAQVPWVELTDRKILDAERNS